MKKPPRRRLAKLAVAVVVLGFSEAREGYLNERLDWPWAVVAISILLGAYYCVSFVAKPSMEPINGVLGPNEDPGKLYPACDYYPIGINGKPCVDSAEFERTGRLVFYESYPTKRSSYVHR